MLHVHFQVPQSSRKSVHVDADGCDPSDRRGGRWPTVTGVCFFQGPAASAGVRPHRPADHGAA